MDTTTLLLIIALAFMVFIAFYAGKSIGKRYMFEVMQSVIDKERKDAVKKSRAVLGGQISEQVCPFREDFPALSSECKFIGAPIDFIAFNGLDEKNVEEIVFIEVKTNSSRLNQTEKSIKDAIDAGKVRFVEYRI